MKVKPFVLPLFFVLGLLFLLRLSSPRSAAAALPPITPPNSSAMFIENVGQFDAHARFQVQGGSGTMWLADDVLWLTLLAPATDPPANMAEGRFDRGQSQETPPQLGVNIKLSFVGANATPQLEPFNRRETSVNYFMGQDSDQWHTDVPVWAGVRYAELYPGLDLELVGESGQLRPRLVCHQNCSLTLQQVRLQIEGAESAHLVDDQLTLTTAVGDVVLPPFGVTVTDGSTPTTLTLTPHLDNNTIVFLVSASQQQPNTIIQAHPPGLVYSTFLGGNNSDHSPDIALDDIGNAYVTGWTYSAEFPTTPGTFDPTLDGNTDAFVVKLNPTGSNLIYATFLGGNDYDQGINIAIDGPGHAYVTGHTNSTTFPTTSGSFDPTYNGGNSDGFVVKLNPAGSSVVYATYLGGSDVESGYGIVRNMSMILRHQN